MSEQPMRRDDEAPERVPAAKPDGSPSDAPPSDAPSSAGPPSEVVSRGRPPTVAPAASAGSAVVCPRCAYDLAGLADAGVCPECGAAYTPESVRRTRPWPGWRRVVLALGWPFAAALAVDLASIVLVQAGSSAEELVIVVQLFGMPLLLLAGAIVTTVWLVRFWRGTATRSGEPPTSRAIRAAPAALLWLIGYLVLAPAVWFGGCAVGFQAAQAMTR